jgi:hypothetical protein
MLEAGDELVHGKGIDFTANKKKPADAAVNLAGSVLEQVPGSAALNLVGNEPGRRTPAGRRNNSGPFKID